MGAIHVMVSALFGIYPAASSAGSSARSARFITALTELSYAFGRDMAAGDPARSLRKFTGDGSLISVPFHAQGPISSGNLLASPAWLLSRRPRPL
ncbi:hypothetical protein BQ8482_30062 [Mesorhizobium delmotii]|uniref:Uncharacterized protein n=1 Tax=Mesorhizobium delmotii TaxID=1631247 RepID=A0A2P9AN72_9HYPH|nr:hypothetical protein BQ8482_30062 [Mesorhizobium delmotii]